MRIIIEAKFYQISREKKGKQAEKVPEGGKEGKICQQLFSSTSKSIFFPVSSVTSFFPQVPQHTGANSLSDLDSHGQNLYLLTCETLGNVLISYLTVSLTLFTDIICDEPGTLSTSNI